MKFGVVNASVDGYLQTVDLNKVCKEATEADLLIEIVAQPGDFLTSSEEVIRFWPKSNDGRVKFEELRNAFAIGEKRTPHQNVEFLLDQLVEIIARALSPGVNDPFTAVTCIDWIRASFEAAFLISKNSAYLGANGRVKIKSVQTELLLSRVMQKAMPYVISDHIAKAALKASLHALSQCAPSSQCKAEIVRLASIVD